MAETQPLAPKARLMKEKLKTTLLEIEKGLRNLPQTGDEVQLMASSSLRVPLGVKSTKDYAMPDAPIKEFSEDEEPPKDAVRFRKASPPVVPKESFPKEKKESPKASPPKSHELPKKKSRKHRVPKKDPKEPSIEELIMAMQMERKRRDPNHVEWTKEEVLNVLCPKKTEEEATEAPLVVNSVVKEHDDDDDDASKRARRAARRAEKEKKWNDRDEEEMRPVIIGQGGRRMTVLASYSDLEPEDVPEDVPRVLGKGRPPLTPEKGQKQRELTEADLYIMKMLKDLPELPLPAPEVVVTKTQDDVKAPDLKTAKSPVKVEKQKSPVKMEKQKSPVKENPKAPVKEKSPEKQKAPSPGKKTVHDEILATVKEMNGEPSERVQMIPGSLLITRMEDGINIQITVRIFVQAGSRLMDIRIECPQYKPSRIHFDGKWMAIQ